MSSANQNVTVQDKWIQGQAGQIFARIWSPDCASRAAPIILLHDSLGCVELWRSFPARICAETKRQVIAYDRLGFGKSDALNNKLSLDFISKEAEADFAAILQQLEIERFVVFGHSVGGGMAANCAARAGKACVALITESAQVFVEDRTIHGIQEARELFKQESQLTRLKKYHGEKAEWVLYAWIDTWLNPAFASWSLKPVLPQVKCPVLAIHGEYDEYGSLQHPTMIGQLAGGPAQLELLPDTYHVPHREKEAVVVGVIAQFLQLHD